MHHHDSHHIKVLIHSSAWQLDQVNIKSIIIDQISSLLALCGENPPMAGGNVESVSMTCRHHDIFSMEWIYYKLIGFGQAPIWR